MKLKFLLTILILFGSLLFLPTFAHAQEEEEDGVRCMMYEDIEIGHPQADIGRTKVASAIAESEVISQILGGDSTCNLAAKSVKCIKDGTIANCELTPTASSQNNILGFTRTLAAVSKGDVIPLNFAYYMRDQVKNVPVVGNKVYAQGGYTDIVGAEIALAIWKIFRNMALGLMSIFLIVIGIMIIMRKKVDARTVLTLQAALPKVIISMVLIVFSFAIGTIFIRFIPAARDMADTIFDSVANEVTVQEESAPEVTVVVSGLAIIGIMSAFFFSGPGLAIGAMAAFLGPLVAIVWLIILLLVYIRTLIIYVQMLVNTVTAPFTFALGAIPGNDAMIMTWFKKMIAWIISIPAMYFLVSTAEFVQKYAITSTLFGASVSGYQGTFMPGLIQSSLQQLFLLMVSPFISMMLLVMALRAPKQIQGFIVGEQKRR